MATPSPRLVQSDKHRHLGPVVGIAQRGDQRIMTMSIKWCRSARPGNLLQSTSLMAEDKRGRTALALAKDRVIKEMLVEAMAP